MSKLEFQTSKIFMLIGKVYFKSYAQVKFQLSADKQEKML